MAYCGIPVPNALMQVLIRLSRYLRRAKDVNSAQSGKLSS